MSNGNKAVWWVVTAALVTACTSDTVQRSPRTIRIDTREGTALNFDVSRDGRFIVFDLLGQLWRLPVDGGVATPLTDAVRETSIARFPALSPDGEWIAYQSDAGLSLISVRGDGQRLLVASDAPRLLPAWSPDGERIVFSDFRSVQVYALATGQTDALSLPDGPHRPFTGLDWHPGSDRMVFSAGGFGPAGVTWELTVDRGATQVQQLLPAGSGASEPKYSPSGSRIAFLVEDPAGVLQVGVRPVSGDTWERVADLEDVYAVRWLTDDELVVAATGRLWRVPAAGGPAVPIPFSARMEFERAPTPPPLTFRVPGSSMKARGHTGLALSPDGQTVAMMALGQLWLVPVGGTADAVMEVGVEARDLTWSPDGRAVAWSGGGPFGTEDLFVTEIATGRTSRLTALPGRESQPSWSPDGTMMAFLHWEQPASDLPPWDDDLPAVLRVLDVGDEPVEHTNQTRDLGPVRGLLHDAWGWAHEVPSWSPGSDALLVTLGADPASLTWGPRILGLDGRSEAVSGLPPDASFLRWASDSSVVFVDQTRVWRGQLSAGAVVEIAPLTDEAAVFPSLSRDGLLLYHASDGLRLRHPDGTLTGLGWPISATVPDPPGLTVVTNVRPFDAATGTFKAASDLVIAGGRITNVGPAGTLDWSDPIQVVDANGRLALPGLIDLHAHGVLVNSLYFGVTTIRDLGSRSSISAAVRDAIDAGVTAGPRVVLGGAGFVPRTELRDGERYPPGDRYLDVSDPAAMERALDLAVGFGVQYAKLYMPGRMSSAVRFIQAARRLGMRVTGHCGHHLPLVAAGMDGIEHLGAYDCQPRANRLWYDDLIQLFSRAGMGVTPTVEARRSFYFHEMFDDEDIARTVSPGWRTLLLQIPPAVASSVDFAQPYSRHWATERLVETDVMLGAGTDGAVPVALHWELEGLVLAGLSPAQALTAATSTAARILGADASIGSLQAGTLADIVILDADPLTDIRNTRRIWKVIKGGHVIDREAMLAPDHTPDSDGGLRRR